MPPTSSSASATRDGFASTATSRRDALPPPPPQINATLLGILALQPIGPGETVASSLRPSEYPAIPTISELRAVAKSITECRERAEARANGAKALLQYWGKAGTSNGVAGSSGSLSSIAHKDKADRDPDFMPANGASGSSSAAAGRLRTAASETFPSSEKNGSTAKPSSSAQSGSLTGDQPTKRSTSQAGAETSTAGTKDAGRGRKATSGRPASDRRDSVSPFRVKREISESPVPPGPIEESSSVSATVGPSQRKTQRSPSIFSTEGNEPLSATFAAPKKKKRKLNDDNASVDDGGSVLQGPSRSTRLTSPTASITGGGVGGRSMTPREGTAPAQNKVGERPAATSSGSNLKLKLKLGDKAFDPKPPVDGAVEATEAQEETSAKGPLEHQATLTSLIPQRQPIPTLPKPAPKRQKDVDQDFTQIKHVGQQVTWNTFWSGIEPYLREIGPEDLAMLRFQDDEITPFEIPRLGRHYQDVWDEEDHALPFANPHLAASYSGSNAAAMSARESRAAGRNRKFLPSRDMVDDDLTDDTRGLGPAAERLLAGFLKDSGPEGQPQAQPGAVADSLEATEHHVKVEDANEETANAAHDGRSDLVKPTVMKNHEDRAAPLSVMGPIETKSSETAAEAEKDGSDNLDSTDPEADEDDSDEDEDSFLADFAWPVPPHLIPSPSRRPGERERADVVSLDALEFESGIKRELMLLGVLGPEDQLDPSEFEDDEVSAALRQCQRLLRRQIDVNRARKQKLAELCERRLQYNEYKKVLGGLEARITEAWQTRSSQKKKAHKKGKHSHVVPVEVPPVGVSEDVKIKLAMRRKLLNAIGPIFENSVPGTYKGSPETTVYDGLLDSEGDLIDNPSHAVQMQAKREAPAN